MSVYVQYNRCVFDMRAKKEKEKKRRKIHFECIAKQ